MSNNVPKANVPLTPPKIFLNGPNIPPVLAIAGGGVGPIWPSLTPNGFLPKNDPNLSNCFLTKLRNPPSKGIDRIAPPIPPPPPIPIPSALPNLVLNNWITAWNGLLNILLNPNLNALDANNAVNDNNLLKPIVAAVSVAPITNKPVPSFLCKFFNKSTLPSAFAWIISIKVFVNHPPASTRKKLTSLPNIPWVLAAMRRTGDNNANWILFSISLSFPSLNPCSASILSLFLFADSLCLSNLSLKTKLSFMFDNEKFNVDKVTDIFSNCLETVVNVNEFCVSKLVVCGSACTGGGTARPEKILEDTVFLTALIPPAIGEASPCSSSILFLLCF